MVSAFSWVITIYFLASLILPSFNLVLLRYSADVASTFPWVVTYGIRAGPVTPMGSKTLPHKVSPNENVRDLSEGDCDAPI